MIGNNSGWRAARIFCWCFTAFGTLFGVMLLTGIFMFHWYTRDDFAVTFNDAWLAFVFLWIGIGGNLIIPTFQRRSTLFHAALERQFDVVPQATTQPTPDSTVLSIPATIELVGRRWVIFGWAIAIYVGIAIIYLPVQVVVSSTVPDESYLSIFWISATFFYILMASVLIALAPHQTIQITEAGLTVRSNESHTIAWDNAHVFAIVGGWRRPRTAKIYGLSSGRSTVRWAHCSPTRWYSVTAPTTSDEEYQRQMEALLSYAAARTGLPLLDLR